MPQFSTKDFLRRTPEKLIRAYFQEKEISLDESFLQQHSKDENSVPDTKNVEGRVGENESWKLPNVLEFISKLPDQKRQEVESDFAEIFSLYDDAGIVALLDEASFHGEKEDLLKEWGEDSSVEARVFSAFLYHPEIWKGATRFHDADTTRASYWCGLKDLPGGPADVSEAAAHRLAQEVGKLFVEMHGKGHHCVVDMYKRGGKRLLLCLSRGLLPRNDAMAWIRTGTNENPLCRDNHFRIRPESQDTGCLLQGRQQED